MVDKIRLAQQGKQMSQMISYMWRWADDDPQKEETKNARNLKKYFEGFEQKRIAALNRKISLSAKELEVKDFSSIENRQIQVGNIDILSKKFFQADPRDWLIKNPNQPLETAPEEVQLLIAIFGEEKIEDENKYISPLFNNTEIEDYKFILNPDSFRGKLEDHLYGENDGENKDIFTFTIAYPPAPKFGEATVTESQLESWIKNNEENIYFPHNIFIPVSTS